MTKEYVLKEDFRREIESVHTKLDGFSTTYCLIKELPKQQRLRRT